MSEEYIQAISDAFDIIKAGEVNTAEIAQLNERLKNNIESLKNPSIIELSIKINSDAIPEFIDNKTGEKITFGENRESLNDYIDRLSKTTNAERLVDNITNATNEFVKKAIGVDSDTIRDAMRPKIARDIYEESVKESNRGGADRIPKNIQPEPLLDPVQNRLPVDIFDENVEINEKNLLEASKNVPEPAKRAAKVLLDNAGLTDEDLTSEKVDRAIKKAIEGTKSPIEKSVFEKLGDFLSTCVKLGILIPIGLGMYLTYELIDSYRNKINGCQITFYNPQTGEPFDSFSKLKDLTCGIPKTISYQKGPIIPPKVNADLCLPNAQYDKCPPCAKAIPETYGDDHMTCKNCAGEDTPCSSYCNNKYLKTMSDDKTIIYQYDCVNKSWLDALGSIISNIGDFLGYVANDAGNVIEKFTKYFNIIIIVIIVFVIIWGFVKLMHFFDSGKHD